MVKFFCDFYPVAPSAILETSENYFSVVSKIHQQPFGFMLYVVSVKKIEMILEQLHMLMERRVHNLLIRK